MDIKGSIKGFWNIKNEFCPICNKKFTNKVLPLAITEDNGHRDGFEENENRTAYHVECFYSK